MSKPLPTGGFEWMDGVELENWREYPCILEVDLECPEDLHEKFKDYPPAPERVTVNQVEKLIPNLRNKERYIVHCRSLKQYESLGLKITKIHRGIKFKQRAWLKPYIELNTKLRTESKNSFEKDFFKLMNNSCFGKTIENIENRVNIKLVTDEKKSRKARC